MKRIATALVPLAFAGAAFAQDALPEVADADANGIWSLVELQAVWADLTEATFTLVDANADGGVDANELQAAWDNKVIDAPAG